MARNRTPLAKAEVSGAAINHPSRFSERKSPKRTRPLGEPYARMGEIEREYWAEFAEELPWLHSGHRVLLRLTCQLAARMDSGEEMGVSASQALSSLLSKLGATPVDETKVSHGGGDEDEDPAEQFFSRPN